MDDALNALFDAAWDGHSWADFGRQLPHSLAYVCAYDGDALLGFVNPAWDGGVHAFLLDTTVHPASQRRGVGTRLVEEAVAVARERGIHWVHVDFEPHLRPFYHEACGFHPTDAGLMADAEWGMRNAE